MKDAGVVPGYEFYWQYIRLAIKNEEDLKAAQALAEMQEKGIKLDKNILTILLSTFVVFVVVFSEF